MSTSQSDRQDTANGWQLPWEGGCRCGQVRLRITAPPLLAMACHCTGCQRMSASAFSLSLAIPTPGFEVLSGEPVIGGLHGDSHHFFCPHCKSWMFTRTEGMDQFVNLRPSMLDRHEWVVPFVETWTDEKLPWATTPAVHSFGALPDMAAFPALIQAYAQQGARPGRPA
ncbi:GFA family protein [Variovorax sp. PAMC26660]|uniref:GFA family protein n=1 Tax=Variovorax sp. PAMC26660 TaxID=2762322 RepID=UPI00164D9104|nr:GFA family protein [Variovorax sp. PAMC26660]QNK70455.1 GFA family protein [Variovorax sp. PAMC26660]